MHKFTFIVSKTMSVVVYTERDFKGESAEFEEGTHDFETRIDATIIGESRGKKYEQPMSIVRGDSMNNRIESMKIQPSTRVELYEKTTNGSRCVVFENHTSEAQNIKNLFDVIMADIGDKTSRLVVKKIDKPCTDCNYKMTIIEASNEEAFKVIDTPEERNMKLVVLIMLIILAMICLTVGGCFCCRNRWCDSKWDDDRW